MLGMKKQDQVMDLKTVVADDVFAQAMHAALRVLRTRYGIANDGANAHAFLNTLSGEEFRAILLRYTARECESEACLIEARLKNGGKV